MSWSGRRRGFLVLIFGLITLGLLASGVAYFWPMPTCADGWKNQGELAVDCGGPCAQVCPFEPRPIVAGWGRVFRVADGWYDLAGLFVNPNPDFGAARVAYRFRLVDANNLLVSLEEGETFLEPGESFVVFKPRAEVGRRVPVRAALELTDQPQWYRARSGVDAKPLVVRRREFSAAPEPLVRALVENVSEAELLGVQATAVLADAAGNAFAASATVVERLAAGASQEISFTWPSTAVRVAPTVIEVYVHAPPSVDLP